MLTVDQQRVNDLLRETITLLCKNGLHFKKEFQIDGLIGITLDKNDVFLIKLKETVHLGDVFVRDKSRGSNRKNDSRRVHHKSGHDDTRSRKNLTPIRVEPAVKYLRPHNNDSSGNDKKNLQKSINEESESGERSNANMDDLNSESKEGGEEGMCEGDNAEDNNDGGDAKETPMDSNDETRQEGEFDDESFRGNEDDSFRANEDDKYHSSASSLQYLSPGAQEEEPVVVKVCVK